MKKIVSLFIVILLTVMAGIFLYPKWKKSQSAEAWAFIPENALLVAEILSPLDWLNVNRSKPVWSTLASLPYSKRLLSRLDSLQAASGSINRTVADFLRNRQVTLSAHVTARDDFDYLFYVPLNDPSDRLWLDSLLNRFGHHPAYNTSSHVFQGKQITEIRVKSQRGLVFSYMIHDQYLVGSYTPFLVEEAIRSISDKHLLANRWDEWNRLAKTSPNSARLYVNMTRLSQAASVFTQPNQSDYWRTLSTVAESGVLSIQSEPEQIRLSGRIRSSQQENQAQWLDIFKDQAGRPMRMRHLIPEETVVLFRYSFQNARRLFDALDQYAQTEDPTWIRHRKEVRNTYDIQLSPLYDWVGEEIALGLLEGPSANTHRLLWVEARDPDRAISQLSTVAGRAERMNGGTAYLERYAGTTIRQIGISEFPSSAFGSLFIGFDQCYYAPVKGYIIFANQALILKQLLDQITKGEVWSNSVRHRSLLQQAKPEANFSVYFRTPAAWNLMMDNLSPHWQEQFIQQSTLIRSFDEVTLQLVRRNGFYETDLVLHHPNDPLLAAGNQFLINQRVKFNRPLQSQVFVVKNPVDQRTEMLVQDDAHQLHFISGSGEKIGQKPLDSPIVSGIYQADLYQNGDQQFVFATKHRLCLLNRKGQWVPGFPLALPDNAQLHTLTVLDYDKSREYRFLVSDTGGNLYMFDKTGALQEGWQPRVLGYSLSAPVRHVRVQDRDYLIATQENGVIHVLNPKGESYAGFPVVLKAQMSSPVFAQEGSSAENTELTLLTDYGELLQINLLGRIKSREQLARQSGENTFRLCPDTGGKSWLVIRRTPEKVTLLGNHSSIFFEKGVEPSQTVICQYYDFGNHRKVISLTQPLQQHTLLCDAQGNLIGNRPVDNQFPISVMYSEIFNKLLVFRASGDEAGIWTIKIR